MASFPLLDGAKTSSNTNDRTYQEVEYLKKNLGPVLVAALAEICIRRPTDPIEYLGHWLLRWRYNEELRRRDVQNTLDAIRQKQADAAQAKADVLTQGVTPTNPNMPPGYGGPVGPYLKEQEAEQPQPPAEQALPEPTNEQAGLEQEVAGEDGPIANQEEKKLSNQELPFVERKLSSKKASVENAGSRKTSGMDSSIGEVNRRESKGETPGSRKTSQTETVQEKAGSRKASKEETIVETQASSVPNEGDVVQEEPPAEVTQVADLSEEAGSNDISQNEPITETDLGSRNGSKEETIPANPENTEEPAIVEEEPVQVQDEQPIQPEPEVSEEPESTE